MKDLESVLFDQELIARRVKELGTRISEDYKDKQLVLVAVLRGALIFMSDLTREISIHHSFDLVGASSYRGGTSSQGWVQITKDVGMDLAGKDVIIVEDIYDSGRTVAAIKDLLKVHHVASIEVCTFLYKHTESRLFDIDVKYRGFDIDDVFVVGYGLDYQEYFRNLPLVGVLKREVYSSGADE